MIKKKKKKKIVLCWMPHRRCVSFSFRCMYVCAYNCINSYRSFSLSLFLCDISPFRRCMSLFLLYEKKQKLRLKLRREKKMTDWLTDHHQYKTIFLKWINGQYLSRFVSALSLKADIFSLFSHQTDNDDRFAHSYFLFLICHRIRIIFKKKKKKRNTQAFPFFFRCRHEEQTYVHASRNRLLTITIRWEEKKTKTAKKKREREKKAWHEPYVSVRCQIMLLFFIYHSYFFSSLSPSSFVDGQMFA